LALLGLTDYWKKKGWKEDKKHKKRKKGTEERGKK
jgi:hypothetical protein